MTIFLLVEKAYLNYPWCQRILRGIREEARKKRTSINEIDIPEEAEAGSCVLLIGASREWNNQMIRHCRSLKQHPVMLSNQMPIHTDETASSVMMDIHSSMALAVNYLHSLGRDSLALYGINPCSSSDPWRVKRFQELTGRNDAIFTMEPNTEAAFDRFYREIHQYDGVICVSDYAAVSLIRRLKEKAYSLPEKLYIVSYGDMYLSKLLTPSITSISDDYDSFGRAALSLCNLIERNENFSSVKINLHSRLHVRQTTENRPYDPANGDIIETTIPENRFFSDTEIFDLAKLETLFSQCDETDFSLIQLLLQDAPYVTMAQECYISETAAKYRVKKMQQICGASSREELAKYLNRFF